MVIALKSIVIYVVHEFPARTQTFVEREIHSVRRLGLPVVPFSIHGQDTYSAPARSKGISNWHMVRAAIFVAAKVPVSLPAIVSVVRLPPGGTKGLSRQLFALARGLRLAQLSRAANMAGYVVHLHCHFMARTLDVLSFASILNRDVTTSATAHAADAGNPASKERLAELTARLDRRIAASENVAQDLLRTSGQLPDAVVHCGVPVPLSPVKGILYSPPIRVMTVARLVEKKGIDICLEAARRLRDEGINFTWTIVGDGPLRTQFEKNARSMIDQGIMRFAGFLDNVEVMRALAQEADLVVLPSKPASDGDSDGIPVILMEAMSYGIPVVSTTIGGIPELVRNDAGWLVQPDNIGQLVDAVRQVVSDPVRARSRGLKGRTVVEQEFSSTSEAQKMVNIFNVCLAER